MMWKKRWVWTGIVLSAVAAVFLGLNTYRRQTVPLLQKGVGTKIDFVIDYREGQEGIKDVTDNIDHEKLLELLEGYQRRRGSSKVQHSGLQIQIIGNDAEGAFYILLEDSNYLHRKRNYEILDGDALLEEITAMIDG